MAFAATARALIGYTGEVTFRIICAFTSEPESLVQSAANRSHVSLSVNEARISAQAAKCSQINSGIGLRSCKPQY